MRLRLTSLNPFERLLVATGLYPTPLLYGFWGMASSRVLMAAVELGVFDALAERPLAPAEVARVTDCDEVGTEALLNALNGFGYVRRRAGLYRNSAAVRRWLAPGARFPMTDAFGLFGILWDGLDDLEGRLRNGEARDFHADRDERFWTRYQRGLAQFARLTSGEIVRRVRLGGEPRRLLDIGGGHATYTAAFCKRYRHLSAEVIDLPGAVTMGAEMIAASGLADRVAFREADMRGVDWGDGFDVVLLFNVLHILTPDESAAILAKAHAALNAGGTLIVLDSAHKGRTGNIDTAGGANELLFYAINDTRAYPESDMMEWVRTAGFTDVRARHLLTVPQSALISAEKR